MSSISLFGVDLPDTYQIGYLRAFDAQIWFSKLRLNLGLVLFNTSTYNFLFADDMPVEVKPGFLLQGERNEAGDTDVFNGQVFGMAVPPLVLSTMEMAMPNEPGTGNTCFRFQNDPNTAKQRTYGIGLSTYVTENYHVLNHTRDSFWGVGSANTVGEYVSEVVNGKLTFHWHVLSDLYELDCVITIDGNLKHLKKGTGDTSAHCLQGSRKLWVKTIASGSVLRSDLPTSTGLVFVPVSKPKSLANVTSDLVLAGLGEDGESTFNADLIDLDGTTLGNSEWLACYNAVKSLQFVDLQWLEFIRDSYHWRELIPGLKNLKKLGSPVGWAELFLWFSYGIRPTVQDVALIVQTAEKHGDRPLSEIAKKFASRHVQYGTAYDAVHTFLGYPIQGKVNAKLDMSTRIQPESMLGQLLLVLQSVGFGVDARNLWELIPYSFVVDWFVNTSDMMKWIDSASFPCWYDIRHCVVSEKRTCVMPVNRYYTGAAGYATLVSYKRVCSKTIPPQPFELRFTDPSGHWLEAAALLITRH